MRQPAWEPDGYFTFEGHTIIFSFPLKKKCLRCLVPGSYAVITVLQTQYMVYEERVKQKINTSKYTFQCYFSGMQNPPQKTSDYDSLPDKT